MRYQGKITNWNDDKGFGFVEPNGGGDKAFVHIKSFVRRKRRPVNGNVITYQQVKDNTGRFRAEKVEFPRTAKLAKNTQKKTRLFGSIMTALFCLFLIVITLMGKLPLIILVGYIAVSLITFLAYAVDKSAARTGRWRTKESTLHLLALLGGWPGAFYAQNSLRHKSSKDEFKIVFWITVLVNSSGLIWMLNNDVVMSLIPSLSKLVSIISVT